MDNVTVIIPHFNNKIGLKKAVNSILAQTHDDYRVIIVDDASDEPLNDFDDTRISIIRHDRNKGAAAARNTGIQAAKSLWIAFLDSDDVWKSGKLEHQLHFMKSDRIKASVTHSHFGKKPRALPTQITARDIAGGQGVNFGSCFMAHHTVFDDVGLLNENLRRLEDWDWLIRFCDKGYTLGVAPIYGSIIHVGAPPSVEAVKDAGRDIIEHYQNHTLSKTIIASAYIEIASAYIWNKNIINFMRYYVVALTSSPLLALSFLFTRLFRIMIGDAPRFFRLFK